MKVKKFQAKTMPDAMQHIKKELGSDAVILQSKEIKKGGILGMFQQKYIEVTAALDDEPIIPVQQVQFKESPPILPTIQDDLVLGELKQLKQMIATQQSFSTPQQFPAHFAYAYQYLIGQEIDASLAEEWINTLIELQENMETTSIHDIKQQLKEKIETEIHHAFVAESTPPKKIIQFVGPTGVGKTTTLAKVATKYILEDKLKVAFITLDTYRIAAIEQLKTYANILNVPIEVAYSVQDYQAALRKYAQYDLIFVDTPGRNFREPQYIKELRDITGIEQHHVSTYLVLSLTSKAEDITDIYHQFMALTIEKVIFTKMDETLAYGSVINILLKENMPIAYLTNGQDVPDDLIIPTSTLISNKVMGRYDNE